MTRPVPGPTSPESQGAGRDVSSVGSKKFQETMKQVEMVEKVSESEFEKPQKRPFSQAAPEEEEEEADQCFSSSPEFSHLDPLPSSQDMSRSSERPPTLDPLPHSKNFWDRTEPSDPVPRATQFKETQPRAHNTQKKEPVVLGTTGSLGESSTKKKAPAPVKKEKKQETLPSTPWQAVTSSSGAQKNKTTSAKPVQSPPTQAHHTIPESPQNQKEPLPPWQTALPKNATGQQEHTPHTLPVSEPSKREPKKTSTNAFEELASSSRTGNTEEREERKKKRESKQNRESPVLIPDPLPASAQSTAAAAQVSAAPYLSPETAALFSKLVGTIFFMTAATPGIARTEVVLNADAFRNSPFYNTTIVLEKYASAPDAFNIQLIGSPEAIKSFSQNSDSLLAAFTAAYEDKKIQFRVGRLDVSLNTERHLFQRKSAVGRDEDALR